jgi:hypothetical protein
MRAKPMGKIIIVVAVLETHMEINAVATMNPSRSRRGLAPTILMICKDMRWCRPHRCMAIARKNPPIKRKIVGSA